VTNMQNVWCCREKFSKYLQLSAGGTRCQPTTFLSHNKEKGGAESERMGDKGLRGGKGGDLPPLMARFVPTSLGERGRNRRLRYRFHQGKESRERGRAL